MNSGDVTKFWQDPNSDTPAILNIINGTNTGQAGRYVYRVDQTSIELGF